MMVALVLLFFANGGDVSSGLWLVLGDAQTREKKMCHTFCPFLEMAFSYPSKD